MAETGEWPFWKPSQAQLSHKYLNHSYTVYTRPLLCNSNMCLNLKSENFKHVVDDYLKVSLLTYKHNPIKIKTWPSQNIKWRNPDSPQSHYQDTWFSLIRQEEKLQLQKNNSLSRSTDYVQEVLSHVNILLSYFPISCYNQMTLGSFKNAGISMPFHHY